MNDFRIPALPQPPRIPELRMPDPPAKRAHYGLMNRIRMFEMTLSEDEEMSIYLPTTPVAFRLAGIGDMGDLIIFYGEDPDGRRVEAYQHHTQTNITLVASAKPEGIEARRMGFETPPAGK